MNTKHFDIRRVVAREIILAPATYLPTVEMSMLSRKAPIVTTVSNNGFDSLNFLQQHFPSSRAVIALYSEREGKYA